MDLEGMTDRLYPAHMQHFEQKKQKMEQQEPILGEQKQLQALPKTSEELNLQTQQLQFSCNPVCSFSNQTYNRFDLVQRERSTAKLRRLIFFYTVVMVAEIIGGMKSNSLAVLTDAAHLLSDIAGFSISLFTVRVSGWEATQQQSFGFSRLEVLGALFSVELIWLISGLLIYEAIGRFRHKNEIVNGKLMFLVAAFGFIVNLIMVIWLGHDHSSHSHSHHDCQEDHAHEMEELSATDRDGYRSLISTSPHTNKMLNINIQGAYLHLITDLIQSVGVMIAGLTIWIKPDWLVVDLLCTLIFSVFALTTTVPMLKNIFCILMDSTPREIDIVRLENGLRSIKGLLDVHDLHVWAITAGKFLLACHVVIEHGMDSNKILLRVSEYCKSTYRIQHVTVQIEQRS